jgi:branched-chain amino acid transport system ATP-binding protein
MDEPSMGLSPRLVQQNFELIQEINRSGVTVFVVEQNAAMALAIAHRGYVLRTGEIVMSGSAAELLRSQGIRQAYLGEMSRGTPGRGPPEREGCSPPRGSRAAPPTRP